MNDRRASEQCGGSEIDQNPDDLLSRKRLSLDEQNDNKKDETGDEDDKKNKSAKTKDDFPMTFNLFNFRKVFGLPPPKYKEFVFTSRLGKKIRIRGKKKDQNLCFNVKTDTE